MIGNVKEWKGQMVLVEAFCRLAPMYENLICLIVGAIADQDYLDRISRIAGDANVGDRVIFAGYQKNVGDYLNSFDIFVHSSIEPEPFGIVILEAMSLSKPVIATSIGAPREIIEDSKSGILFDPSSESELAGAIEIMLLDRSMMERIGKSGNLRFLEKFTSEINARKLMDIYQEVSP